MLMKNTQISVFIKFLVKQIRLGTLLQTHMFLRYYYSFFMYLKLKHNI
jgi:hypothetical protein